MSLFDPSRLQSKVSFHAALQSIISKYSSEPVRSSSNFSSSPIRRCVGSNLAGDSSSPFDDDCEDDDIIDLETMTIMKNNGRIESMCETPFGAFIEMTEEEIREDEERKLARASLRSDDLFSSGQALSPSSPLSTSSSSSSSSSSVILNEPNNDYEDETWLYAGYGSPMGGPKTISSISSSINKENTDPIKNILHFKEENIINTDDDDFDDFITKPRKRLKTNSGMHQQVIPPSNPNPPDSSVLFTLPDDSLFESLFESTPIFLTVNKKSVNKEKGNSEKSRKRYPGPSTSDNNTNSAVISLKPHLLSKAMMKQELIRDKIKSDQQKINEVANVQNTNPEPTESNTTVPVPSSCNSISSMPNPAVVKRRAPRKRKAVVKESAEKPEIIEIKEDSLSMRLLKAQAELKRMRIKKLISSGSMFNPTSESPVSTSSESLTTSLNPRQSEKIPLSCTENSMVPSLQNSNPGQLEDVLNERKRLIKELQDKIIQFRDKQAQEARDKLKREDGKVEQLGPPMLNLVHGKIVKKSC